LRSVPREPPVGVPIEGTAFSIIFSDSSVFSVPVMDAGAIFFSSNIFLAAGDGFLKHKLLLELLLLVPLLRFCFNFSFWLLQLVL
jgi:hypothetical protein